MQPLFRCVYTFIYVHILLYALIFMFTNIYIHIYLYTHTFIYTYIYVHKLLCTCTFIYRYVYIHIFIHTLKRRCGVHNIISTLHAILTRYQYVNSFIFIYVSALQFEINERKKDWVRVFSFVMEFNICRTY